MVLITSACILYVLYVHYYSDEDITLEGISPRLARALGPQIAHHFNVLLNPRLALGGPVDRRSLEADPNNGTEEGDEEIFSDFQSANAGHTRLDVAHWSVVEDEDENTSLLPGVSYSRSSSATSSSSSSSLVPSFGRGRNKRGNNNSTTTLEGPKKSSSVKFVGLRAWATYVKHRYQEEVRNEKELFAKEWRRFRSSRSVNENDINEEGKEEQNVTDENGKTVTELKTFTSSTNGDGDSLETRNDENAVDIYQNPYGDDLEDDSDDDSCEEMYSDVTRETAETSSGSTNEMERVENDDGMEDISLEDDNDNDTKADDSKDSAKEQVQNENEIINDKENQQETKDKEKEQHLTLLKQTLEELEADRRAAIVEKGPNDMKVGSISRKAGLLSIKFGQIDRGMLLLREYVRIRTQNFGYELDTDLANVLYTLGDFYCQEATNDLGNGKFEFRMEKGEEERTKQKEALSKARRCWTGALRIYQGVGLDPSHARICNLKYKIDRVERGQRNGFRNGSHHGRAVRERMKKWGSWIGSANGLSEEKIPRRTNSFAGSSSSQGKKTTSSTTTPTDTTGHRISVTTKKEEVHWC